MKTKRMMRPLMLMMAIFSISLVMAQGNGNRGSNDCTQSGNRMLMLELTDEQQDQVKDYRLEMQEKMTALKLEAEEKELELKKLMIADQIDETAVFAKVDEISEIRVQMRKARIHNKIQIRSILTDEQKVMFDSKVTNRGGKSKKGKMNNSSKQRRNR